jgi:ABC-type molybdate transport system ATPase subunit
MRETGMLSSGFWTRGGAAALLALVWLGGCGPQNVTDLRNKSHHVYSFEAPVTCEAAYDRIVRRTRQRYRIVPMAAHQLGISSRLQPSGQSATITLWDSGRIGIRYILTADLKQIDSSRTQVDVHYATKADLLEARLWEQWTNTPLED